MGSFGLGLSIGFIIGDNSGVFMPELLAMLVIDFESLFD